MYVNIFENIYISFQIPHTSLYVEMECRVVSREADNAEWISYN